MRVTVRTKPGEDSAAAHGQPLLSDTQDRIDRLTEADRIRRSGGSSTHTLAALIEIEAGMREKGQPNGTENHTGR